MRLRLLTAGLVLGLLAGLTFSSWAAPSVKGGGGVGGTCTTANALGKFSAAFTLACSAWTDTGTTSIYTGSTVSITGSNSKIDNGSSGNILDLRTSDSQQLWLGTNGSRRWGLDGSTGGLLSGTRCANTGTPAVCAGAPAGSVVIAAAATSVVVNTTVVTANSQVFAMIDRSLGTLLSVTCDTTSDLTTGSPAITARTAGTSFTIAVPVAPAANPMCLSYFIVN